MDQMIFLNSATLTSTALSYKALHKPVMRLKSSELTANYHSFHGKANWDPDSSISKHAPKRALVEKWIQMGQGGRMLYSSEGINLDQLQIPSHVPRDLLSDADRSLDRDCVIWIRTWFGDKDDKASQDTADEGYSRLARRALYKNDGSTAIREELFNIRIYDEKAECSVDAWEREGAADHFKDGIALAKAGTFLPYLVTAAMHFPDQFDADPMSEAEVQELDEDPCAMQLLLLVADRIACEEGWVLQLAINHRGQILTYRIRDIAQDTMSVEWHRSDGFSAEDKENWYCAELGISGWK